MDKNELINTEEMHEITNLVNSLLSQGAIFNDIVEALDEATV